VFGTTMVVVWVSTASSTAALIIAAVARVVTPQAAALGPHQPQPGVAQPPYQP
jgi:hypothetical protein